MLEKHEWDVHLATVLDIVQCMVALGLVQSNDLVDSNGLLKSVSDMSLEASEILAKQANVYLRHLLDWEIIKFTRGRNKPMLHRALAIVILVRTLVGIKGHKNFLIPKLFLNSGELQYVAQIKTQMESMLKEDDDTLQLMGISRYEF